jgi:hypothetical protein
MNEHEKQVEEFDKLHGGDDGYVVVGRRALFPDAARRSLEPFGAVGFEFILPPTDPKDLLGVQEEFWETRLEYLVQQFTELRGRCQQLAKSDGSRFNERVEQLKTLQTQIRSARSKLSRIVTQEKGFTQADVSRAWETWNEFSEACATESSARQKYESLLLGKSSAGPLEKAKHKFDEAKKRSQRTMEKWNNFQPSEARAIVSEELDQQRRAERERELEEIEV